MLTRSINNNTRNFLTFLTSSGMNLLELEIVRLFYIFCNNSRIKRKLSNIPQEVKNTETVDRTSFIK